MKRGKGSNLCIILLLLLVACGTTVVLLKSITKNENSVQSSSSNYESNDSQATGSEEDETIENSTHTEKEKNNSENTNESNQKEETTESDETQISNDGTSAHTQTLEETIHNKMESMTMEQKVAQMFIITPEALTGNQEVTDAGAETKQALTQYPVGGLIYFTQNMIGEDQVKELLSTTAEYAEQINGLPLFLSVDEEGGTVARIANNEAFEVIKTGDMADIGAREDYDAAYQVGVTIGNYLSELGFNLNYAPDADVYSNPENRIVKRRSFGSNPEVVSKMDQLVLKGLKEQNVWGVYKHFPGHGSTVGDTHDGYAYTDKTLEELLTNEMIPFIKGISEGIDFIMVGHISAPNITGDEMPSSLSYHMITEILRLQLGYDGVVMTDALNMNAIQNLYSSAEAAVMTIQAGTDLLLMPADFKEAYQGVLKAVEDGTITKERIDRSIERILKIKLQNSDSKIDFRG